MPWSRVQGFVRLFVVTALLTANSGELLADEIAPPAKQPMPTAKSRSRSLAEIREVFEFAKERTPSEKKEFVKHLLRSAADAYTRNDFSAKFVLIDSARRLAEDAGEVRLAAEAERSRSSARS